MAADPTSDEVATRELRMPGPADRGQCRTPGCRRQAGPSGFCDSDRDALTKRRRRSGGGRATRSLTPDEVAEARRMRAAFKTNVEIAAHFGVSDVTIGRLWRKQ